MFSRSKLFMLAAACVPIVASDAMAQANYIEDFEGLSAQQTALGPQELVDEGWVFRNQSDPVGGAAWYTGNNFGTVPFDGTGYMATDGLATDYLGGEVSVWAILPEIDGLIAGDVVTIWVYGGSSAISDTFFDIRYSSAGTDTGSGPGDVGDFSTLLFTGELALSVEGYHRVSAAVPGNGRIALRFHSPYLRTFAGGGANFAVDALTVGPAPADPCDIVIPDPGEDVIWSAADGPYTVCQDLLVPAGARVEIEAGTQISFSGGTLRVEGELAAHGTALLPIVFTDSNGFNSGLEIAVGGQGAISFAQIDTKVTVAGQDAVIEVTDSTFGASGVLNGVADLFVIERCVFDGGVIGDFGSAAGSIRIVDTRFINGAYPSIGGLLHLDNIEIDGQQLRIIGETLAHPVLLENISVTNNTSGPGIKMYGPNFMIGDQVTLQNNLYPVEIDLNGAGVMWGSKLPTKGNINNSVLAESLVLGPQREWGNTGIPYVVAGDFPQNYGGSLLVEPGTNIKFGPGAGAFLIQSAELVLKGTAEEPIVLESLSESDRWFGLKWVDDFDATARHTVFDGGEITVQSDGGVLDLIDCTVQNSLEGTASVTGGIVRLFDSKIINNEIGMVTTSSGRVEADGEFQPSVFAGNTVAIDYRNQNGVTPYLRFNWWGASSGPYAELWPQGEGDLVLGVHPAAFNPFLTEAPAQNDENPVIEMMPTYFTAQVGDKIILRWESSDDDEIVAHRVEFANHDFPSWFSEVATLPGDANTYEFIAPLVEPTNLYPTPSAIRIVAVDSAGQESSDKSLIRIPYQEDWAVTEETFDPIADAHPHDRVDVCWSPGGGTSVYLLMDGIALSDSQGGSNTGCLSIGATMPYSSTDTARMLTVSTYGAGGRIHYSFSDYFSIRPDTRFGDAPPLVTMSSPAAGESYAGGTIVPIEWDASDDESMRSFNIQGSYDGGRTWHFIARGLPADARSFAWNLPQSLGIPDVRVRVIGFDHRFQDSSDTTGVFTITASTGSACAADYNADGVLDVFDVFAFLDAFNAGDPVADLSGDGILDVFDVFAYLDLFSAGCP